MNDQSNDVGREYEAVLRLAPITFLVLNEALQILKANGDSENVLEVANDELVDRELCEILANCSPLEDVRKKIVDCFELSSKQEILVEKSLSGEQDNRFIFITIVPLPNEAEQAVLLSMQDVTAWRQVDEAFQRAQRFHALGTLAGGIAHDFNNLLTTIVGKVSLVRAQLGKEFELDSQLQDVLEVAFKAAELADELLTFASGGAPYKEACYMEQIVEDAINCALVPFNTRVLIEKEASLPQVAADHQQLKIALANLLVNSAEAMDAEGQILVRLKSSVLADGNSVGLPSGTYVTVEIMDEGPGIPIRDLSHVCEPYFTTKAGSHGLGLTASYSIVQRHGGQLRIQSRWREGTTITIYVPIWREVEEQVETVKQEIVSNRILIMDDDESLRDALSTMLEYLDWEVVQSSCGEEAISEYEKALKENKPFKLVILDLIICCGMGGDETVRRLADIDSNLRAIVSSGYSNDPIMSDYRKHGFCAALPKPYSLFELDNVISKVASM